MSTGNLNVAALHQSQSALSTSTGSLNATAVLHQLPAPNTLTGNPNAAPPLHRHHQHAPNMLTDSHNAELALLPLLSTRLAPASPQHLVRLTLQLRQLPQQACQPSRLLSLLPAWSPPSCRGNRRNNTSNAITGSLERSLVRYRNVASLVWVCLDCL